MLNNHKEPLLLKDLGMIYPKDNSKRKVRYGTFKCFCGNIFTAQIGMVKNKSTSSCGCFKKVCSITHNLRGSKIYSIYMNMLSRVLNPKNSHYKYYGKRGILICKDWKEDKTKFFEWALNNGYSEELTIDRINVDGNYEPSNCRFVNRLIQSRNTQKIRANNTSGFRGISFKKDINKWVSKINVNKNRIYLGNFNTAIEAAKAYDNYIILNKLEHTINML